MMVRDTFKVKSSEKLATTILKYTKFSLFNAIERH